MKEREETSVPEEEEAPEKKKNEDLHLTYELIKQHVYNIYMLPVV